MIMYSAKNHACYLKDSLGRYPNIPDDLVELTSEEHNIFMGNVPPPEGKILVKNEYPFRFEGAPAVDLGPLAKQSRESAIANYDSTVVFDGVEFDSNEVALINITRAIRMAERDGLAETYSQPWRLADNSWRDTTLSEIREVKLLVEADIDKHFADVWDAFTAWSNGPKDKPFEV